MSDKTSLPADVIAAIHANRKIDAIKLLREHRNIGLKEAKQAVDAYVRENKHLLPEQSSGCGPGTLIVIVLGVVASWFIYKQIG